MSSDAPAPEKPDPQMEPGSRLGQYEIQAKLGSGGMGWVYQALDHSLNRTVALKVLPPGRLASDHARSRLAREAQAASALNHPNIVTVYEIGREGDIDFIAMERVPGQTLARKIAGRGMELREALRLATQVADALAAAHEAGVVHRDLKPGNVMVTERGLVKVLDFGVAKRSGPAPTGDPDADPTLTMATPGRVFGTIAYMSPEQAEGKDTDARSDIFSFGCLLYEMVTGRRAFHGDGLIQTLAAVVAKEPRPAHELAPRLPKGIGRIIEGCLHKKRMDRWQHMADIKVLLEHALKDLETADAGAAPTRRRRWLEVSIAALAGALVASGAFWMALRGPAESGRAAVLRKVTADPGLSAFPSLSRDGSLLAFASDRGNQRNLDIWIQQIGGRDPLQLTSDPADDTDPAISPDGTRVVFRSERAGGGIYAVPALGGETTLLAAGGRNPRYSPDGRWIAYWEGREMSGFMPGSARVFVVEAGGGQPRQVGTEMAAALHPVWSPKGDALLVLGRRDPVGNVEASLDWWVLPFPQGPARRTGAFAQFKSQGVANVAWQVRIFPLEWRDRPSRALFAAGVEDAAGRGDAGHLWEIGLPASGAVREPAKRITAGPGYHMHASVAPASDRGRMVFASLEWSIDVWSIGIDAERGLARGEMKRITGAESYAASPSVSADGGSLVFLSRRLGQWALRAKDLATGKEWTLKSSPAQLFNPKISGDGNLVAYSDNEGSIFSVPRAGGAVAKLCERCGTTMGVSFDGRRVSYEPYRSEDLAVYDVGQRKSTTLAVQPSGTVLSGGQLSPDGKWIAFHSISNQSNTTQVWIARIDGKLPVPPPEWIAVTGGKSMERGPVWSPGGSLLYFLSEHDGSRCIWARRLEAATKKPLGEPFAVLHFHSARQSLKHDLTGVTVLSVASGRMLFSFGEMTGNIWLEERPQ
jgi:serine/threonine protein kinase